MKNEYIIINKTTLQKRIEELDRLHKNSEKPSVQGTIYNQLSIELKQILSQSTPLIPEIEKAFNTGFNQDLLTDEELKFIKQDYISNLKLDI